MTWPLNKIPKADQKAFVAYSRFKGAAVTKVEYDDGNVHLSFDNGWRIALSADNFEGSDFVWDDRPVSSSKSR